MRRHRPHQRDGFGEIADIIVGQREQHRIGALGDQAADQARFGVREAQRAGERGQRPAALGIGRRAEIIRHQPQLVVAAGLVGEAVEKFGEAVHASASPTLRLASDDGFLVLVAIADDIERPRFQSARRAPMHQRILLAVRNPDFAGAGRGDGRGQAVPVGVIGNDQRQLDAVLARPRADPHPAGGKGGRPDRESAASRDRSAPTAGRA